MSRSFCPCSDWGYEARCLQIRGAEDTEQALSQGEGALSLDSDNLGEGGAGASRR